jgi:nicotinamidase-related amidase
VAEALLVLDVQPAVLSVIPAAEEFVTALRDGIAAARRHSVPVIFVTVGFRRGHPDVSPANTGIALAAASGAFDERAASASVAAGLQPLPSDLYLTKRRVSAFSGTDLTLLLRSLGVDRLAISGLTTAGAVLSTVRAAADEDYRISVLSDGCADGDPLLHRVLVEKVLSSQATVMTIADWTTQLDATDHLGEAHGPTPLTPTPKGSPR